VFRTINNCFKPETKNINIVSYIHTYNTHTLIYTPLSLTHAHTLSYTHSLTHTLTHCLSLTHLYKLSFSLLHTYRNTHCLLDSHTHTHTHTHTLYLSHTQQQQTVLMACNSFSYIFLTIFICLSHIGGSD
jgi:hypothetical protein